MPVFDQTGPAGEGSKTGGGLGPCTRNQQTILPQKGLSLINRKGSCPRGKGFFRNGRTPLSLGDEKKILQQRLKNLEEVEKNNTKNKNKNA